MRYFLILFMLFIFVTPAMASAQDLFIKKHKSQSVPEQLTAPEEEKAEQKQVETQTKTMTATEMANLYYKNCLNQQQAGLTDNSKKDFCACTSAHISKEMSVDEIRAMYTQTPEGVKQRERMMALVYVPCMEFPVKDMVNANCVATPAVTGGLKNYKKVCQCLGDKMGIYTSEQGASLVATAMAKQDQTAAGTEDILNTFMEGGAFQTTSQQYIAECVQRYELGWGK